MSKQVKPMGKEYTDPEQRKRFLKDNSDAVVEKSYMKNFTPEQLQGFKEDLAECCMGLLKSPANSKKSRSNSRCA